MCFNAGLSSLIAGETLLSIHMHGRLFPMVKVCYSFLFCFSALISVGGCFRQQKLQTATPEEKFMVFEEIMPHAIELVTDIYGSTTKRFNCNYFNFDDLGKHY